MARKARKTISLISKRRRPANHGFTLVELLLVVTLIAVLAGVAMPRLSSTARSAALQREADTLAELVRLARAVSLREGTTIRLEFDPKRKSYHFESDARGELGSENAAQALDGLLKSTRTFLHLVELKEVRIGAETLRKPGLTITAGGRIEADTELVLRDVNERTATVLLGPMPEDVHVRYNEARDDNR